MCELEMYCFVLCRCSDIIFFCFLYLSFALHLSLLAVYSVVRWILLASINILKSLLNRK